MAVVPQIQATIKFIESNRNPANFSPNANSIAIRYNKAMVITSLKDRQKYQSICTLSVAILREIYEITKPGITTIELDNKAGELLRKNSARSSFFGVKGEYNSYRYNMCIAVNDVVVHGVPNKTELKPGDIVKLDFGLIKDSFYTDHCVTVVLNPGQTQTLEFVQIAKDATLLGVAAAKAGNQTGDIGNAIYTHLRNHHYDVAKEYIGHGIGKMLHDKPSVPAFGRPQTGAQLKNGMVICVEAQVVEGSDKWYLEKDGWTVRTADGKNAAMFEYMVLVGANPTILTDTRDWPITK